MQNALPYSPGGPRDPAFRLRALWLLSGAVLLGFLIWGRLIYWQLLEHSRLSGDARSEYSRTVELPAARGRLLDRDGRPLAIDVTAYDVFVAPNQVPPGDRPQLAAQLAAGLGGRPADYQKVLDGGGGFAYIARAQPKAVADRLRSQNLKGVGLEAVTVRSYLPGGVAGDTLAANLLGFVNRDGQGQYGVEGYYQRLLAGRAGHVSGYRDLAGNEIVVGGAAPVRVDPIDGQDLVLTLDSGIQQFAEQALAAGVQRNKGESGSVVVLDSRTGGVVAWADYPSYDANAYATTPVGTFIDPAISYLYEPGSVMKVVTLAGAIEHGAITPSTTINDPGWINVDGTVIHDAESINRGNVTYTKVLESSLNVGAIHAEQAEGKDAFYSNLVGFGFGAPSGIDVAAESALPLRPLDQYRGTELATASFGQGIDVNLLQMVAAVNVIANRGRYVQPHVVDRIGNRPAPAAVAPPRQVVSTQTAAQVDQMMRAVVQHGSGWTSRISGFDLDEAGKTGTSQIPVDGKYSGDVWSSYVGYMPASNPRFTMLVLVRKPHNPGWLENDGYYVAEPIWKEIAQQIVLEWHIAPTNPQVQPVPA